ncbi:MAG: dihydroorotate dehydrogenase [Cyanobacteriota bacterium]
MVTLDNNITSIGSPDLSIKLGKLNLKNPIITASGTFGYADEYEDYVDLKNIGAIVTKGITLEPRKGNPQPRLCELDNALINSIGLENIGIKAFISQKLPVLREKEISFIVNIAGFSIEEYIELAQICENNNIEAIEVNVSCPNVKTGCLEFGTDESILYNLIASVREKYTGTLIVKLTPNVTNPVPLAQAVEKAGADVISAINTVRALNVKTHLKTGVLTKILLKGGMSGPAIKPIALNYINTIRASVKIPIIGMGGISSFEDMLEFIAVGSQAIQIGTINFIHPDISEILVNHLKFFLIENNIKSFTQLIKGD